MQYAGAPRNVDFALMYRVYLIMQETDMKDVVAFLYGTSFKRQAELLQPESCKEVDIGKELTSVKSVAEMMVWRLGAI